MHKTQRLLVKMRSEEEIKATKKMVANAGPATRLAALKIQDAREKVQMAKAERLFDNLVGRDVIIVANGTRVCRVADMDKTLEKHLKNPSMTEQWFDQGGGHLICDEEVKQQEMETFLQYRFTVENAGGYPAIGLKVANTPDKRKSGRMCSLDGNGAAEVIKCQSPVPDILGAKLSKPMKLAVKISVSHPGTFSLFPYGTDKVCRLVSSKRDGIVCDEAKPTDPDDPATLFKFLPAESLFEQGKEFVTYDSKRGCDDLEAKLEESELESKACQDRCCANQDCQFITFIPAKQGAKTLPMGQCQLFRNCRALTKRGASAMAEATIFQKTGIGCNKPAADQQEVQALI